MEHPVASRTFVGRAAAARVLSQMLEQADTPSLSDLSVHAGGKTFRCHRAVLAASSPVFAAMFQSSMREPTSGELQLADVRADVFSSVRSYMYGRPLQVLDENALSLSAFVRRYEIASHELPDFLDALLASALTLDNVLAVRDHADAHAAHKLRRDCDRFITARMKVLPETPSFLQSGVAAASAALRAPSYVSRDIVGRKCAQYVMAAAVAWLRHDEVVREVHRDDILAAVDVEGLSLSALVRASRDAIAVKSAPFQARLLRAFARKAERDLTFGPLGHGGGTSAATGSAAGFAAVDQPAVLRRGYVADDIDLFPCPPGHALYHARQRRSTLTPSLVHPRFPQRFSSALLGQRGSAQSSDTDDR